MPIVTQVLIFLTFIDILQKHLQGYETEFICINDPYKIVNNARRMILVHTVLDEPWYKTAC
jgi:hypothetical protein